MRLFIDIPDYDGNALDVIRETNADYTLEVDLDSDNVVLSANTEGLVSFAKQLLYMAYHDLPCGAHIHYDSFFTKVDCKYELIIEKKAQQMGYQSANEADSSKPVQF
jgi:hypothetical protein